jgi:hypothetical protein
VDYLRGQVDRRRCRQGRVRDRGPERKSEGGHAARQRIGGGRAFDGAPRQVLVHRLRQHVEPLDLTSVVVGLARQGHHQVYEEVACPPPNGGIGYAALDRGSHSLSGGLHRLGRRLGPGRSAGIALGDGRGSGDRYRRASGRDPVVGLRRFGQHVGKHETEDGGHQQHGDAGQHDAPATSTQAVKRGLHPLGQAKAPTA